MSPFIVGVFDKFPTMFTIPVPKTISPELEISAVETPVTIPLLETPVEPSTSTSISPSNTILPEEELVTFPVTVNRGGPPPAEKVTKPEPLLFKSPSTSIPAPATSSFSLMSKIWSALLAVKVRPGISISPPPVL